MVCEYFRQESRRWETRIFWYKVRPNIAKYTPELDAGQRTPAGPDGRGKQGVEACADRALGGFGTEEERSGEVVNHTYTA